MAKRILIAEDETRLALILFEMLASDFSISVVDNGLDLYRLGMSAKPGFDLIIADVKMPYGEGDTTADLLRKMGVETPILLISGHAGHHVPERCRFLAKPFGKEELRRELTRLFEGRG